MVLFDSHCHINSREFDADRAEVIARMKSAGLCGAVVIGCEKKELAPLSELVNQNPGFLWGAWACHPEYEARDEEPDVEAIVRANSAENFVAVGETGLDYYWCKPPRDWQVERFLRHIEAAKILRKPIIVHARDAEADAARILRAENAGETGFVMHCFSAGSDVARDVLDAGGMIGINGNVTFKKSEIIREACKFTPLSRILAETDCPYLAPVPRRGRRNEPAFVAYTVAKIAELHGCSEEEAAHATASNALNFFHIDSGQAAVPESLVSPAADDRGMDQHTE